MYRTGSLGLWKMALLLASTINPVRAARPALAQNSSQATAAIEAMMGYYNWADGLWEPDAAWWLSGNALQATLDYMTATGSREYLTEANNTISIQRAVLPWWPSGGGDFRSDSTDDTGWWALAMVRMFDLTGDTTYLDIAKEDEAYIYSYWNSTCGGGVIWDIQTLTYKNAISNELYLKLAASLHNRVPGDTLYLSRAEQAWTWFNSSGLINNASLINDGLQQNSDGSCSNNGETVWTYNQGVILGGLAQLYEATGDSNLLTTARQIADAVVTSSTLSPNGILTESCETTDCSSDTDAPAFKGIFVRNLAELDQVISGSPYQGYLNAQAQSAYTSDRNSSNFYGLHWAGPFDTSEIARQASAVSLLTAVL